MFFDKLLQDMGNNVQGAINNVQGALNSAKDTMDSVVSGIQNQISQKPASPEPPSESQSVSAKNTAKQTVQEPESASKEEAILISPDNALKLIGCMIVANGRIDEQERVKLDAFVQELLPAQPEAAETILRECAEATRQAADPDEFYDLLLDVTDEALVVPADKTDHPLSAKELIWDLLLTACADDEYDRTEKRLMRRILHRLHVEESVASEMENCVLALKKIQEQQEWIKTTNRPYLRIAQTLEELEKRQQAIVRQAAALIAQ